jgi:TatD DNase family protein
MLIDTHSHINFKAFESDGDEVVQRALAENIWMVAVGTEYKTSKRALYYANRYDRGVYAAVGLHPMHLYSRNVATDEYDFTTRSETFNRELYEKLASFQKVVAIGEIGLDYYHLEGASDSVEKRECQQEALVEQLKLARELELPVIIHCRQAHDDMLKILRDFRNTYRDRIPDNKPWGVMHCFSGDEDLAWEYFKLGMIVSFTGLITFSRQWDDLIRRLPNDKFMLETDCPFMTPEPYRGQRNEPVLVKYVAKRIAEIKNMEEMKVADLTTRTARQLFGI